MFVQFIHHVLDFSVVCRCLFVQKENMFLFEYLACFVKKKHLFWIYQMFTLHLTFFRTLFLILIVIRFLIQQVLSAF